MRKGNQNKSIVTRVGKCLFLCLTIVIIGSAPSCTPRPAVVEGTNLSSVENIALGKTIFDNSCGKCHDLPNATDYSARDWVGIMNSMAPKAKLTDVQHEIVYNYLISVKK